MNTIVLFSRKFYFILVFLLCAFCFFHPCNVSAQDTIRFEVSDTLTQIKHSPTRAAMLSAVLPGTGQIYNKKLWKAGIVYAGMGTLAYFIIHFNSLYNDYLNAFIQYNKFGNMEPLTRLPKYDVYQKAGQFNTVDGTNRYLNFYKESYRRYRDLNFLILAGVYVLNIIDATVDAYFFNYDISDDLSLKVRPAIINNFANQGAFGLKLCFSLN